MEVDVGVTIGVLGGDIGCVVGRVVVDDADFSVCRGVGDE